MKAIIYKSVASDELSLEQIETMLIKARVHNNGVGITGMLLYADGAFVQYIEGDDDKVDALYANIEQDSRHHHSILLFETAIETRMFKDFDMSFRQCTTAEMNPLLVKKDSLLMTLLQQFAPNH